MILVSKRLEIEQHQVVLESVVVKEFIDFYGLGK